MVYTLTVSLCHDIFLYVTLLFACSCNSFVAGTNTRITDPEILERRYPVLLRQFGLRKGSGGEGIHPGGDGVIREIEPLRPLTMSILSERRTLQPYGLEGGKPGQTGMNLLMKKNGIALNIGAKRSFGLDVGESVIIKTPGGGGYGKK